MLGSASRESAKPDVLKVLFPDIGEITNPLSRGCGSCGS